jgi:hypothetical protein
MVASPKIASAKNTALIPSAKLMFCQSTAWLSISLGRLSIAPLRMHSTCGFDLAWTISSSFHLTLLAWSLTYERLKK